MSLLLVSSSPESRGGRDLCFPKPGLRAEGEVRSLPPAFLSATPHISLYNRPCLRHLPLPGIAGNVSSGSQGRTGSPQGMTAIRLPLVSSELYDPKASIIGFLSPGVFICRRSIVRTAQQDYGDQMRLVPRTMSQAHTLPIKWCCQKGPDKSFFPTFSQSSAIRLLPLLCSNLTQLPLP